MSEENVELVRRAFDAVHSGEPDAFRRYFPEDCIWYPLPEWPGSTQALLGHRGIVTIMAEWRENFDDYTASLHEVRDFGDRVVCIGEQAATIKSSGGPVRQRLVFVCSDFRNGMSLWALTESGGYQPPWPNDLRGRVRAIEEPAREGAPSRSCTSAPPRRSP